MLQSTALHMAVWAAAMIVATVAEFLLLLCLVILAALVVYHGFDAASVATGLPKAFVTIFMYSMSSLNRVSMPLAVTSAAFVQIIARGVASTEAPNRAVIFVSIGLTLFYTSLMVCFAIDDTGRPGNYYSTKSDDDFGLILPGIFAFLATPRLTFALEKRYALRDEQQSARSDRGAWPPPPSI